MRHPRLNRARGRLAVRWTAGRAPSGLPLPPRALRAASGQFATNDGFLQAACADAIRLVEISSLAKDGSVLDIGCGAGRLAIGLAEVFPQVRYVGIDVMPAPVAWCNRNIHPRFQNFEFHHIDAKNDRYNPAGARIGESFRLPIGEEFDVIYAYSVFSHMESHDVSIYLAECARLLRPDGLGFVTAFVENGVADEMVNPVGYGPFEWRGPLHAVRYSMAFFNQLVESAGLRIEDSTYATETDGQTLLTLRRT